MLSGFAASGKTTIGQRYLKDHPLALLIEGDELIVNLGQWLKYEDEARLITFELMKSLARTQLALNHDVLWPFLLTNAAHIAEIESIAKDTGAQTYEFLLDIPKPAAIARLLKRGRWGEAGLDALTDKDLPVIEELYDTMVGELSQRPQSTIINVENKSVEQTYQEIMAHLRAADD